MLDFAIFCLFRRSFLRKFLLRLKTTYSQPLLVSRKMISFCLLCTRLFSYHQMNYTSSPVSTGLNKLFLIFFLKTGVTFPFFSSLIYETRLVAVAERHTRSDCGLYLLDTIYICIKFIGAPIVVPLFAFLPSNLPVSIRFLNQEFASKESKSVCGYQSFRMRWAMCE